MCGGVTLSPFPRQGSSETAVRRIATEVDLQRLQSGLDAGGLKPSRSAVDLSSIVQLLEGRAIAAEVAARREGRRSAPSTHSSGDDTARGSPTSGYEQLLRSRSPSAVLYSGEGDVSAASKLPIGQAAPAPEGPLARQSSASVPWHAALLAADHPFMESAANFSVVEVPSTSASRSGTLSSCSVPSAGTELAAAASAVTVMGAGADVADDPICDAAATQCAQRVATAAAEAAEDAAAAEVAADSQPPSPSCLTVVAPSPSPAAVAAVSSPFARMSLQMQTHPSMISHSPPHAQLSPGGGRHHSGNSPGDSGGNSPGSGSQHSRSGSLAAEIRDHSLNNLSSNLSRRSSVDCCTWGQSCHLSEGHAAEELFYRLNHARQTVDFVKRQTQAFSGLTKAAMGVWEALELLNTLREYESALLGEQDVTPDMPLLEHALQCAEACRTAYPEEDYMHLAGLLAPLGKLLAHAKFGAEPQFAICGETFPVGCRFHPSICYSQYFSANPDRRKRLYNSPTGVYRQGCGLGAVLMSWGAGEYLHMVLRLNDSTLPPEALFCLRHQNLRCVFRPGAPYGELLSEFDRVQLPRLSKFQQLCQYQRMPRAEPLLVPVPGAGAAGDGQQPAMQVAPELRAYYDSLLAKYLPDDVLLW